MALWWVSTVVGMQLIILGACDTSSDADALHKALQDIANSAALQDNTSYSFAVYVGDLHVAVAAGPNDRVTGEQVTSASQYPGGSAVKPYITVSALRLYERGLINLDEPIHLHLDPWLEAQGFPSLLSQWNGNEWINEVTLRMLLSMTAGLMDYDDDYMQEYFYHHLETDILPIQWLGYGNKSFYFKPGEGCAYTSEGFVLAGMYLAAVTGSATFTAFDQRAALGPLGANLTQTTFMEKGLCSSWPGVVHQYGRIPQSKRSELLSSDNKSSSSSLDTCNVEYPSTVLQGTLWNDFVATSVDDCCVKANALKAHFSGFWTFYEGTCSMRTSVSGTSTCAGGNSGIVQGNINPNDFYDLYNSSCLNGWTMGNIAVSPFDAAKFYHALANNQLITQESLESMMHFKNFTAGWKTGGNLRYGMGLLNSVEDQKDVNGNSVNWTTHWGHPGEDWGSSMTLIGYFPNLEASMVFATNSIGPMNYTKGFYNPNSVACLFQNAVIQFLKPEVAELDCTLKSPTHR
eukprot:m.104275 g.104275  ORF g.104275 m.104275 type:complete len:517 (+) comp27559_c1_seq2:231-1781(+)